MVVQPFNNQTIDLYATSLLRVVRAPTPMDERAGDFWSMVNAVVVESERSIDCCKTSKETSICQSDDKGGNLASQVMDHWSPSSEQPIDNMGMDLSKV